MKEKEILKLREMLKNKKSITAKEIFEFWRKEEPELKPATSRWRIYELRQKGILFDVGKGVYSLGSKRKFIPDLTPYNLKEIYKGIREKFPYLDICIWSTHWLHNFMVHQPGSVMTIVEVDKDTINTVLYFLQEKHKEVMISPTKLEIDRYVLGREHFIIIKPLIRYSPIKNEESIKVPKIEKILVDILLEKELFFMFQGQEIINIFKNISREYSLNMTTMLYYAKRRGRKEKVNSYLKKIRISSL